MLPSRIVTPHYNTITNLADTIIQRLFHQRYRNSIMRYNTENIVTLLNYITQHTTHIPEGVRIQWRDAMRTISHNGSKPISGPLDISGYSRLCKQDHLLGDTQTHHMFLHVCPLKICVLIHCITDKQMKTRMTGINESLIL